VSDGNPTTGTIHDIGYKRYVGTRRASSTRWLVIMRHQIAIGWKKWWRYKLALLSAVITTFVAGGFMYIATSRIIRGAGMMLGAQDAPLTMADGVVPLSIQWYCRAAFILTLTLGATIVATDTQSGAFTFYYVRSIRPVDYVLGKLAGFGMLVATIVLVPPVLLVGLRLGLSDNLDDLVAHLHLMPKVLAIGALATLAYTAVPLALSSLVANRRYALALWAAYYLIVGNIAAGLSLVSSGSIGAIDIQTALQTLTFDLFDIRIMRHMSKLTLDVAVAGLLLQSGAAIAVLWYQVSRDQKTGVGGSS
jgi:hypothetical protein